jgi:hypothetical protein
MSWVANHYQNKSSKTHPAQRDASSSYGATVAANVAMQGELPNRPRRSETNNLRKNSKRQKIVQWPDADASDDGMDRLKEKARRMREKDRKKSFWRRIFGRRR